jgi:hypothetical protein
LVTALVLAVLPGVSGCGGLPTRSAVLAQEEGGPPSEPWVTAFGTGETEAEAREVALGHLAESVVTVVESRWRSEQRVADGAVTSRRAESVVASLTRLQLDAAETVTVRPYQGGYYVRVRLPRGEMDRLRQQARAKAAAYAQLDRLQSLDEARAGPRLRAALEGLSLARRDGVLDGAIAVEGRTTTFGAHFRQAARAAAGSLRLLAAAQGGRGDRVRLHVVHEASLAPQSGLPLALAGETRTTSEDGGIELRGSLARPGRELAPRLALPGAERELDRSVHTLGPVRVPGSAGETRLHVHSIVPSVPVKVRRHGREVASLIAPGSVSLANGADYTLRVPDGSDYRGVTKGVHLPQDAAVAYRVLRPQRSQYGRLRLQAPDRASWIYVAGPEDGRLRGPGGVELDRAPAGPYRVVVARPGAAGRQRVLDRFTLPAGGVVERRYKPLPHRLPYQGGYSIGITPLHPGRGPREGYALPEASFGNYQEAQDAEVGALRGAVLDFQSFWPPVPFTWQLSVGALRGPYQVDTGLADRETVADLTVLQLGAGAGLYSPIWRGADPALAGWVTGGAVVESVGFNDSGYSPDGPTAPELPGGRTTNRYAYLEAGLHWGWLKVAARWPLERVRPHLQIGLGWMAFRSGYRRPPTTEARPGVHYRSPSRP